MAWIRWRTTLKGRRLAYLERCDDLGEVRGTTLRLITPEGLGLP